MGLLTGARQTARSGGTGDDQGTAYNGDLVPPSHRQAGRSAPEQWPLSTFIEFGAQSSAVPCARLHTRHVLREWRQTSISDSAELIVAELVTNAIDATRAVDSLCPVKLWLLSDYTKTLVLVGDASHHHPQRIEPADEFEGGRGLLLVEAVAAGWGWYHAYQRGITKIVWAELRVSADSDAANTTDGNRM
jgi:anti-sigma regulatory factor (Ser/Thr protein kinase)